jgi:hypothetical protein
VISLTRIKLVLFYSIDIFCIGVILFIAQFILNPKENQQRGSQANCQSGYINESKYFMPENIPDSDTKEVPDHI